MSYELVSLVGEDIRIVICNSGVTRGLTDSAYNDRRSACESGASHLALATGTEIREIHHEMIEAMIHLEKGLKPYIDKLQI